MPGAEPAVPILRIARPTRDIAALIPFYTTGLGLEVIGSFDDHAGFDGIMFGRPGAGYHLEFTCERGAVFALATHPEDLLVFYVPDHAEWTAAVARMESAGHPRMASHNPYWDVRGRTFLDPDGRRVVLQHSAWP
jgi:catechol 2,3-dioxygenase-like lactoylglutathione lyase family enzyme